MCPSTRRNLRRASVHPCLCLPVRLRIRFRIDDNFVKFDFIILLHMHLNAEAHQKTTRTEMQRTEMRRTDMRRAEQLMRRAEMRRTEMRRTCSVLFCWMLSVSNSFHMHLCGFFVPGKTRKRRECSCFAIMCVSMAGICHGQCERVISVMDSKFIVCLSLSDLHKQGAKASVRNKVS